MLMSTVTRSLIAALLSLIAGIGGCVGGYIVGRSHGLMAAEVDTSRTTITALNTLLEQHAQLVTDANAASKALNGVISARQTYDYKTTKTLKELLNETSALRAECRLDDRIMRELTAARDRAAAAASGGVAGAVPAAD